MHANGAPGDATSYRVVRRDLTAVYLTAVYLTTVTMIAIRRSA